MSDEDLKSLAAEVQSVGNDLARGLGSVNYMIQHSNGVLADLKTTVRSAEKKVTDVEIALAGINPKLETAAKLDDRLRAIEAKIGLLEHRQNELETLKKDITGQVRHLEIESHGKKTVIDEKKLEIEHRKLDVDVKKSEKDYSKAIWAASIPGAIAVLVKLGEWIHDWLAASN